MYLTELLDIIDYRYVDTINVQEIVDDAIPLILKDLEIVYPSLYELFNQNYIYLNGKKFVHLGESKSLALVNDNFKVIVLIEKDKLENQEAPFLNRFEKHIIDFSHLLNEELKELSSEIFDNLKEIFDFKNYIPDKYTEIKEFVSFENKIIYFIIL